MKVEEELDVDALMDTREDLGDAVERSQPGNPADANPASNGPASERPAHQLPDAAVDLRPKASGPRSGSLSLQLKRSTRSKGPGPSSSTTAACQLRQLAAARLSLLWSG